ncbi:hypothetical protein FHS40_004022 [Streptomyces spectabilis]|uniref:Uncharacterized protein n=1 Tax=Streptomyces spectabilis TaxID=68270 RepID=A0A7W8AUJ4_STRST|nr:hypothetical protein [Streptomyces spectabilis]
MPWRLQFQEAGDAPRCLHRVVRTHSGLGQGMLRMKARTQLPARPECFHQLRHRQADGRLRVADPQTLPALGSKVRHESPYPFVRHLAPLQAVDVDGGYRRHSLLEARGPAQCARGARAARSVTAGKAGAGVGWEETAIANVDLSCRPNGKARGTPSSRRTDPLPRLAKAYQSTR